MVTREDVENFLSRMEMETEEIGEGMWLARNDHEGPAVVISYSPPLLVFRLKVLDVPKDGERCAELYRKLLEYNASDLVHAAYGLEEDDVVLTESLELENLDFNEFQATVDSFQLAVASHMEALSPYRGC